MNIELLLTTYGVKVPSYLQKNGAGNGIDVGDEVTPEFHLSSESLFIHAESDDRYIVHT